MRYKLKPALLPSLIRSTVFLRTIPAMGLVRYSLMWAVTAEPQGLAALTMLPS